ncbi:MAG: GNAT family N-acetyltransferase [Desulfobacterales bacterium]|jgi:ribosomal protein S18 acetylase RimI-like enzyme
MPDENHRETVRIRPFAIDDHAAAIAMWQATEGIGLSVSDTRANIAAYLERNPGMSFVAVNDQGLIGAVLCGTDGRRGYLHHLAVDPAHRGRGIGRDLVNHCLDALRRTGLPKCHLFLFSANRLGCMFWEHIGWTFRSDLDVVSIDLLS